ncbi:unnamed protein product [Boreogadus saida]
MLTIPTYKALSHNIVSEARIVGRVISYRFEHKSVIRGSFVSQFPGLPSSVKQLSVLMHHRPGTNFRNM